MDWILVGSGGLLMLVGLFGAVFPALPGPPLSFAGLLLLHFSRWGEFSPGFLLSMGVIAGAVTVVDYLFPVWGTKKLGGSQAGVRGSTIGLIIGVIFFPPFGIIIGPLAGAVIAELGLNRNGLGKALQAGFGSLVGFLMGTGLKLCASFLMTYYFVIALL